jgi:ribulose-bisphosphate carboxylase small chain
MVESEESYAEHESRADRVLKQVAICLRKGCVIVIEHTPMIMTQWSSWKIWGKPCCYNGNVQQIFNEIDRCRETHENHHIRLNIEDFSCQSRFSLVVHNPSPVPG